MRTFFLVWAVLLGLFAAPAEARLLTADLVREPQSLLPYCSWLPDPEGAHSVESISSGSLQERFAPLGDDALLKSSGPVWIRLVMIKMAPGASGGIRLSGAPRLVMNLGQLPSGQARVFFSSPPGPVEAEGVWHAEDLGSHENILLPEPGLLPVSVYIRLNEMPGLWFAPTVSPKDAAKAALLPSDLILPGLLIAAAVACLLRAAAERAIWALWAALFTLCCLAQTVLPLPGLGNGLSFQLLPPLLAPGLALILLPHVGRCFFRTDSGHALQDAWLYFVSLAGVALALAPLVPGLSWLPRLFPLWPLVLVLLFPVCARGLATGKPGSLAFTGVCVLSAAGAGLTLAALFEPTLLHPLTAQAGLWGLALGCLGLPLARGFGANTKEEETPGLELAAAGQAADQAAAGGETKDSSSSYFNLQAFGPAREAEAEQASETIPEHIPEQTPELVTEPVPDNAPEQTPEQAPEPLPETLPEEPVTEAADTEAPAPLLPDFAGSPIDNEASQNDSVSVISLIDDDMSGYVPVLPPELDAMPDQNTHPPLSTLTEDGLFLFSLHSLVRDVHDIVEPLAKARGLIFSWYIAPSLPSLLEGDAPRLRGALSLLLQNAVQVSRRGAVQLSVRKTPGSDQAGDLLFTIKDNGSAQRTDAGFFHAWDLAARNGGSFSIEYSPQGGTQISFTVRFSLPSDQAARDHLARHPFAAALYPELTIPTPDEEPIPVLHSQSPVTAPDAEDEPFLVALRPAQVLAEHDRQDAEEHDEFSPTVVVGEMTTSNRRLLASYLADVPHEHINAESNEQVLEYLLGNPVALIIFDADMPEPDIIRILALLREEDARKGLATPILVLTSHTAQSARMLEAGASYALCKPYTQRSLRDIVALAVPYLAPFVLKKEKEPRKEEQDKAPVLPSILQTGAPAGSEAQSPDPGVDEAASTLAPVESAAPAPETDLLAEALRDAPRPWGEHGDPPPAASSPDSVREPVAFETDAETPVFSGGVAERDVDILAEALRDAPPPSGLSREVDLPPRHSPGAPESPAPDADVVGKPVAFEPDAATPVRAAASTERDVDILAEALRDAPPPSGLSREVDLPPRHSPSAPTISVKVPDPRPATADSPQAAPMLMDLSPEDVRPPALSLESGGSLLDFVVTEPETISAEDSEEVRPAEEPAEAVPAEPPAPEAPPLQKAPPKAAPVKVTVSPIRRPVLRPVVARATSAPKPPTPETPVEPVKPVEPVVPQMPKIILQQPKIVSQPRKPETPVEAAPVEPDPVEAAPIEAAPVEATPAQPEAASPEPVTPDTGATTTESEETQPLFPLPGIEGEGLDPVAVPMVPGIIYSLRQALEDAMSGAQTGKSILVQEASARLAAKAEHYDLHKLGKIARCVERAAEAGDMEATSTLLDDLQVVTGRYLTALDECFKAFLNVER